jgi:nicotinate phosphoribosyltransferase
MSGLCTDLYELNMAASYLRRGMTGPATFSLFVRHLPPDRGFLVAAGLQESLEFLERFRFDDDELAWLRGGLGFDEQTVTALAELRFTGDVWAVPEGRLVFADEPLLEVTGPIAEAQLVETALLNHISFRTAVASKAARCRLAAGRAELVDFSFRRTQGVDAAMAVARASAMVGFAATSNVEAARRFRLRASGTMAHSFVEAFGDERQAFRAFAQDFPDRATFLVDTYDPLQGLRAAMDVIGELRLTGGLGVRLDSGDLGPLAVQTRRLLDESGFQDVRIVASGGLDEYAIADLVGRGAPIDAYGVGTRMGVSADAPYLDSAYKLVRYGDRPVAKLSPGKPSLPGAKQAFRGTAVDGDLLGLRDEPPPAGHEQLLVPMMAAGRRTGPSREDLAAARERFEADLAWLPEPARRLHGPHAVKVELTEPLRHLRDQVHNSLLRRGPADQPGERTTRDAAGWTSR